MESIGTWWKLNVNTEIPEDNVSPNVRIKFAKGGYCEPAKCKIGQSRCRTLTTLLPTLKVVAAHMVFGESGLRPCCSQVKSSIPLYSIYTGSLCH